MGSRGEKKLKPLELTISFLALIVSCITAYKQCTESQDAERLILKGVQVQLYGPSDGTELSPVDPEMNVSWVTGIGPTELPVSSDPNDDKLDTRKMAGKLRCGLNFRAMDNGQLEAKYLMKEPTPKKDSKGQYPYIFGSIPVILSSEYQYKGSGKSISALYSVQFRYRPASDGSQGNTEIMGLSFSRFASKEMDFQAVVDAEFKVELSHYKYPSHP